MSRLRTLSPLALLAALAWLALAPPVAAHGGIAVGDYVLTIGWRDEPALVGEPNGIQVFVVIDGDERPVNSGVELAAVVSTAGQSSEPMELTPQFVVGEFGTPGEYGAELIPTSPGDYTFHLTGTIGTTEVDVEMTSGEDAFSRVEGATELEFPVKLPSLGEVATRLDRIDGRIAELQSGDPGSDALVAANAAADGARAAAAAADRALLVGVALGVAGVLAGLVGIALALRAGRGGPAST